jgi:hypothetical protein
MSAPAIVETISEGLPALVSRAAHALASATTAAEVLDAREVAAMAYDAAKRAERLAKAKGAHDELVAATHRAQADALLIESQAKRRLADEYDAAQERGEVAKRGWTGHQRNEGGNFPTIPTRGDTGIPKELLREGRRIRDAEAVDPGIVGRVIGEALERGEAPRRADVNQATMREKLIERAAQDEKRFRSERDFKALRKLWRSSTADAQRMFRDYISKE